MMRAVIMAQLDQGVKQDMQVPRGEHCLIIAANAWRLSIQITRSAMTHEPTI